jgi:ubiquitin-conjugating enzyme E2 variant
MFHAARPITSKMAMASSPRPALPDPTQAQLALSAFWLAAAALLLGTLAWRIFNAVNLLQWWVPVALLGGVATADFASGVVHWAADTWGRADLPIVGPRLLVPFRVHHVNPDDFLRRRFLDANGDVAAATIPVLLVLLLVPPGRFGPLALCGLGLCGFGVMTNQIHQWAHMPTPPGPVRVLQGLGILLRPVAHAAHHRGGYDRHYCITTGWCNRPLEAIGFFRGLERAITRVTGALPRADERRFARGEWHS